MANRVEANFKKWLLDDKELFGEVIRDLKNRIEVLDNDDISEIIDAHYNDMTRKLKLQREFNKLDLIKDEYISLRKEGITVTLLSGTLTLHVSDEFSTLMCEEITDYFITKGILIKANYSKYKFILDFTDQYDEDTSSGQVINLKLEDIICNMITYKLEFIDAVVSTLTYKTLQAEIIKCGECGITLSINNDTGLCEDCESRIDSEINQELYEDIQKKIDGIMARKYPKCPKCGSEVYLLPPQFPEIDESKWVNCTKCNWSEKFIAED